MKRASDVLREGADLYEQRNAVYGDNYLQFGHIMAAMFPNGLTVKTADDWNRLGVLVQCMAKGSRYANNFSTGGHADSSLDASVYWAMLSEIDQNKN